MGNLSVMKQPTTRKQSALKSMRLFLLSAFMLNLVVLVVRLPEAYGIGSILGFSGTLLMAMWPFFLGFLVSGVGLILTATRFSDLALNLGRIVFGGLSWLRGLNWFFSLIPPIFWGYLILSGLSFPQLENLPHFWIVGHLALLSALFVGGTRKLSPSKSLLVSGLFFGFVSWVIYFIPDISAYPLTLGWSETSRYYYASLFFAPTIYGKWVPLSSLHPTRYLMQSLPFILPALPLWFHRLWQPLLWLGVTLAGGGALAARFKSRSAWVRWAVAIWFAIFCFQGPVYYHLMVPVILILSGFNREKLWRSMLFVALASIWAGISRVNWFPVPGMLAVALYVLETPYEERNFWQYWRWPVLAILVGMPLAFGAQAGYAAISGNPPEVFASSFNSPLFWYRLFPNEAYGPGIINLLLTAIFPSGVILLWRLLPRLRSWRVLRLLSLLVILLALLAAGLVVSTKIGGGDNLHNMDSFLVMLAVITAYVGLGQFKADRPGEKPLPALSPVLIVLALLVPLIFVSDQLRAYPDLDSKRAWQDIADLQAQIDLALADGGEVLFIQQRHLLTFDMIKGVELAPKYEKVFLMEMAMSGNAAYLDQFWADLESRRFDLIISEPLALVTRPASDIFGEENNVWVTLVAQPLDIYYEEILAFPDAQMVVLAPRLADD